MSHETSLTKEEERVEALLGQLQPLASAQSRDKLMFAAGRTSAGRVHRWQGISGMLALMLLCSLMIHTVPSRSGQESVPVQIASSTWPGQHAAPTRRPMDKQAYINIRQRVLERGLDALPDTRCGRVAATGRVNYTAVLERYMNL